MYGPGNAGVQSADVYLVQGINNCLFNGTNGTSVPQMEADFSNECVAAHQAGLRVFTSTLPPCDSNQCAVCKNGITWTYTNADIARQQFNAYLLSNPQLYDGCVNGDALFAANVNGSASYFSFDGLHNNSIGNGMWAAAFAAVKGSAQKNLVSVMFQTNWPTGVLLTNTSPWETLDIVAPSFATSPATTVGKAGCSGLLQPPNGGGYFKVSAGAFVEGGITSVLQTNYATIHFPVPPGWGYCPCSNTDLSGSGYTAGLASTLTATLPWTNFVTIHP